MFFFYTCTHTFIQCVYIHYYNKEQCNDTVIISYIGPYIVLMLSVRQMTLINAIKFIEFVKTFHL